jgi:peptidoglycan/xylan/chitin deacetylase (PgdA/CDA1 family)
MIASIKSALREAAKIAVFAGFGNGPRLRRRIDRLHQAGVTPILNLHRVAPDDRSSYRPLEPEMFEELLAFVKRDFAVVTIAELSMKTAKPKMVLSFDDGYRDFALYAAPILRRHGLRANQNIIPQCIETGLPPLNIIAQDFVGRAPRELLERIQLDGFSAPRDHRFGHRLSHFIKMRSQAEQDALGKQLLPLFFEWDGFAPTAVMSLDEVRSVSDQEMGAHSYAHSSMEFETDEFLDQDVSRCAEYFRTRLGQPMTIYAFPNGSCREGQAERVLAHGVEHVLLVGEEFDKGGRINRRFTYDARSPSEARFKALGGFTPI